MADFFELESSSLGSSSRDPVMAAINGESADEERSPLDFSAESSDVSEKIVPMSGPDPLELDKPIGEDEFVRQARRAGTDPLTGSDESAIQTRSGSDLAGNNRRRAYDIGTLDGNESYSDSVSRRDRKDFYEFRVDTRGRVEIDLSDLSDNADLYLHNRRGKAIKRSRRGGSASESISRILNPGDYYVQVRTRSRRDSTDYDLGLNFTELTPDNAGNNRRKARDLGSLSGSESYSDFVGRGDRLDFYTFTLDGERDVGISLDGLSGNADLHLFKKGTRGVVGRSTNSGSSGESINESLDAGTYYLRVKSKGGAGTDYDANFNIVEPGFVTGTVPNTAETWGLGSSLNISNFSFSGKEGDEGTFQVRLNEAPLSDVTLKFEPGKLLTLDADDDIKSGPQDSITFTRTNWNQPRTVSFIAEKDDSQSDRISGNTIDYVLSGELEGGGTYDLGTIANTYAPDNNNFNIDLDFRTDHLGFWTPELREVAQQAADDWARLIANELKGLKLENSRISPAISPEEDLEIEINQFVDDMLVYVSAYGSDDDSSAWGTIDFGGSGSSEPLTRVGSMTVDSSEFTTPDDRATLYSNVSHEIGHLLGLVGNNEISAKLISEDGEYFTGKYTREFNGGKSIPLAEKNDSHPDHNLESQMSYYYQGYIVTELDQRLLADSGYQVYDINVQGQPRPMSEFGKFLEQERVDDSPAGANDVGTLSSNLQTFNGFMGDTDPKRDYYRFEVGSGGGTLELNLSGDVDAALKNSNNKWMDGSYNSGTQVESTSVPLESGTYYVGIFFPKNSEVKDTDYELTLQLT